MVYPFVNFPSSWLVDFKGIRIAVIQNKLGYHFFNINNNCFFLKAIYSTIFTFSLYWAGFSSNYPTNYTKFSWKNSKYMV